MSSGIWKTLFDQFSEVMDLVKEGKRDPEEVSRLLQAVIQKRRFRVLPPKEISKPLYLTLNLNWPVEKMIEFGNYDYVDSNVTSKNFPAEYSGIEHAKAYILTTEDLFGESRSATSEEVLSTMREKDLKPAGKVYGIFPLLTVGLYRPDEQKEAPIVDLGSAWRDPNGSRRVPILWGNLGRRGLSLSWLENRWNSDECFLAVRAQNF